MMRFGSAAPIFFTNAQKHRRRFVEVLLLECGNEAFGIWNLLFSIRVMSNIQYPMSSKSIATATSSNRHD